MATDFDGIEPDQVIFLVLTNWLQKPLGIIPDVYRRGGLAIADEPNPRDYFIFGALETLQRVGYTLQMQRRSLRSVDLTSVETDLSASSADDRRNATAFVEHFVNVQLLCMRKLVELLVDVLCFGLTNEQAYYRRYMLIAALEHAHRLSGDWRTYFSCENRMMATVGQALRTALDTQLGYDETLCWFGAKNGKSSSVASRFRKAMSVADPAERISLGFSYNMSYGFASRSAHVGIGAMGLSAVRFDMIDGYQRFVELLGLQTLSRLIELAEFQGSTDDHRDVINVLLGLPRYSIRGNHPEFAMNVGVGDLVLAPNYLGVVCSVRHSEYGNIACEIQPIAEEFSLEEERDWWPSVFLRPWIATTEVLERCRAIHPEIPENPSDEQRVKVAIAFAQAVLRGHRSTEPAA